MKRLCLLLAMLLILMANPVISSAEDAMDTEILTIEAQDGVRFDGKLRLPKDTAVDRLVVFVNGSGPNTYDNHREFASYAFDYFDLFAEQLTQRGIGFFSYNTRGVTPNDVPPQFMAIDEAQYKTYIPSNEVGDIATIINTLKAMPSLADASIYLLGWSAGTIIAPQVVLETDAQVDGLLLCGYTHDTMAETLDWQQTGGSSMVFYRMYFDAEEDGSITRESFDADPNQIAIKMGVNFDALDVNQDGILTEDDFALMLAENREAVFAAFEGGDDAWLAENYGIQLTSAWYRDYVNFPPNRDVLPTLDLPIYIFHGKYDANVSYKGVEDLADAFAALGKENLHVTIVEDGDHDLNYLEYVSTGNIPEGLQALFDACEALE